jgi:hypothetical protein
MSAVSFRFKQLARLSLRWHSSSRCKSSSRKLSTAASNNSSSSNARVSSAAEALNTGTAEQQALAEQLAKMLNPAAAEALEHALHRRLMVSTTLSDRARRELKLADIDQDGVLSPAEFDAWFRARARVKALRSASEPTAASIASGPYVAPTRQQLVALSIRAGVPFLAFGFVDNTIMVRFTALQQCIAMH